MCVGCCLFFTKPLWGYFPKVVTEHQTFSMTVRTTNFPLPTAPSSWIVIYLPCIHNTLARFLFYSVDCWCKSCHFKSCQHFKIKVIFETYNTTYVIGTGITHVLNTYEVRWNDVFPRRIMSNSCPYRICSPWKAAIFKGLCVGIMWHSFLLSHLCYKIQNRRHCIWIDIQAENLD